MKTKTLLTLFLLCNFSLLFAQISFVEDTENVFPGINDGQMQFADIDGDNDLDLFLLGYSNNFQTVGSFYENESDGVFVLQSSPVPGLGYSAMAFEDVDGDNDIDLLVSGQNNIETTTKLFLNDGSGNFTESATANFSAATFSTIGFADINGDEAPDFLITGLNSTLTGVVTEFYVNDGNGSFSLIANNEVTPTYQGAFDFADIDGDNDLDILLTGTVNVNTFQSAKLYLNDGSGSFSEVNNTPFIPVNISSVDFEDIDGDNDLDVLITGSSASGISTNLYTNDGAGNFSLVNDNPLVNIIFSDCAFEDIDLDGDPDLVMAGRQGPIPDETVRLYTNDGEGNFTEVTDTPFTGATGSTVDFGDVNGDNVPDLFIAGLAPDGGIYSKLYLNTTIILSLEETVFGTSIDVYPNPFNDYFIIESTLLENEVTIELMNSLGQLVKLIPSPIGSQLHVNTEGLATGSYFLRISDNTGRSETISLVKTK